MWTQCGWVTPAGQTWLEKRFTELEAEGEKCCTKTGKVSEDLVGVPESRNPKLIRCAPMSQRAKRNGFPDLAIGSQAPKSSGSSGSVSEKTQHVDVESFSRVLRGLKSFRLGGRGVAP